MGSPKHEVKVFTPKKFSKKLIGLRRNYQNRNFVK